MGQISAPSSARNSDQATGGTDNTRCSALSTSALQCPHCAQVPMQSFALVCPAPTVSKVPEQKNIKTVSTVLGTAVTSQDIQWILRLKDIITSRWSDWFACSTVCASKADIRSLATVALFWHPVQIVTADHIRLVRTQRCTRVHSSYWMR